MRESLNVAHGELVLAGTWDSSVVWRDAGPTAPPPLCHLLQVSSASKQRGCHLQIQTCPWTSRGEEGFLGEEASRKPAKKLPWGMLGTPSPCRAAATPTPGQPCSFTGLQELRGFLSGNLHLLPAHKSAFQGNESYASRCLTLPQMKQK